MTWKDAADSSTCMHASSGLGEGGRMITVKGWPELHGRTVSKNIK